MISYEEMKNLCNKVRVDILEMIENVGSGHIGGSLSIVEALVVIYTKFLNYDAKNPQSNQRDFFVLSKGHAGPALYSILSNLGFFDREELFTLNQGGTNLPSHPDRIKTKGIDMTTGSLGQGISAATGLALSTKIKHENRKVFTIMGDGELNEGQCWEAFQFITHYNLNNLILFIDDNKRQLDGFTKDILNQGDLQHKFASFGFNALVVKGNSLEDISSAIEKALNTKNKPTVIILDTIKGQGIKFFEDMENNHSVKFDNEFIIKQNHKEIDRLRKEIEYYEAHR